MPFLGAVTDEGKRDGVADRNQQDGFFGVNEGRAALHEQVRTQRGADVILLTGLETVEPDSVYEVQSGPVQDSYTQRALPGRAMPRVTQN